MPEVRGSHFAFKVVQRVRNRNSFTVCLRGDYTRDYGQIEFFFQCKPMCFCMLSTNCSFRNLAVVTRLCECDNITLIDDCVTNATLSHVTVVSVPQAEDVVVVYINDLGHKCVFMQFQDYLPGVAFLATFPNAMETDDYFDNNLLLLSCISRSKQT